MRRGDARVHRFCNKFINFIPHLSFVEDFLFFIKKEKNPEEPYLLSPQKQKTLEAWLKFPHLDIQFWSIKHSTRQPRVRHVYIKPYREISRTAALSSNRKIPYELFTNSVEIFPNQKFLLENRTRFWHSFGSILILVKFLRVLYVETRAGGLLRCQVERPSLVLVGGNVGDRKLYSDSKYANIGIV